jgi:SAM-dependent methyltransferase
MGFPANHVSSTRLGYSCYMTYKLTKQSQISDRQRWDPRYRDGAYSTRSWPTDYLKQLVDAGVIDGAGRALDVACGRGRNSVFLAAQGYHVDAVDVAPVAIAQAASLALNLGRRINWQCRDLTEVHASFEKRAYSLIVMVRFVAPELFRRLLEGLDADGLLVIEEHMQWPQIEALVGPASQRFRVAPGEILEQLGQTGVEFDVVDQFEGLIKETKDDGADGMAAISRLCIRRRTS